MSVDPVRDAAIEVLLRVSEKNAFLTDALDKTLRRKSLGDRGNRFLTQLVYGTVRHQRLADHILGRLLQQPITELPRPIHLILRMGVFQALFCSQVTFPAMVHTSVDLAKKRGHPGTARLTNAVLKRVPQRVEDVPLPDAANNIVRHLGVRYSLPDWLVQQWIDLVGIETATAMCAASTEQAPTTIRANTLNTSPEDLKTRLEQAQCLLTKTTPIPDELTVLEGPVLRSKLFHQGLYMLQDPASMLPAHLVEPRPGEWVLDMCAAPGGKSTHLAQIAENKATIVAADAQLDRITHIVENVERLGASSVRAICADGSRPCFRRRFDAVLLDAPCTGLGTLRRHPDLKWRARPDDATRLAAVQRELLRAAAQLCENGGRIVYSVCTLTREETLGMREFAESLRGFAFEDGAKWLNEWKISPGTYRTLPESGSMDGFFLMRLRKSSSA
ncbi:MAG: 16S rRNA (cytosine(967)-C(5))-methyltransferase RsmB [Candidatus Hydrogenedentes bacterium]|nr:16S rRNA (cytosine(967)-C(5))-methyltransferase RsmB [Candidatus Hydrogenedentota bacterium]